MLRIIMTDPPATRLDTIKALIFDLWKAALYPIRVMTSHRQSVNRLEQILKHSVTPEGVSERMAREIADSEMVFNALWVLTGPHDRDWVNQSEVYQAVYDALKNRKRRK